MAKDRTKDLTQGTPWKVIAGFSLPVIGGNLFQLFYTLADSMIVGRTLGADALAAVGATATIVYFVLCFIQGLTGGCGILLGQAFGAGNEKQVRESVSASVWISALFTIVLTVLCCSMVHPILRMLNTPVDIYDRTYTYLFIIFLGNGATVFYNMISNILRALGDSRTPLYFLIFACCVNIVLDIVLIAVVGMGVAGAGRGIYRAVRHGRGGSCMGDRAGAGNFRGIVHCVCAETFYNPASFCERMAVFCRDGMASFKSRIPDGIPDVRHVYRSACDAGGGQPDRYE